ncbi:hypothetical protein T265_02015 [Opisthorchis viverrini]|uniref:Uncharacterized protein n=1 Tax=Opisthorchis viverrini TaxID=6198 RepID=A0A074ZXH3_OPIVI|nr:hypothetical protein T265_02015 [Opisthorchis viverrini]KER31781.1 hypothetical protein T265_02015 [Opisthorchis viverrini]
MVVQGSSSKRLSLIDAEGSLKCPDASKVHEADAMFVPKKPARTRMSRSLPKRIRRPMEEAPTFFSKSRLQGIQKMSWLFVKCGTAVNQKSANGTYENKPLSWTSLEKNKNVLFRYMRPPRKQAIRVLLERQERRTTTQQWYLRFTDKNGWPPLCLRHSELGMENSTLRQTMVRHT